MTVKKNVSVHFLITLGLLTNKNHIMKPTIGRIVIYQPTYEENERLKETGNQSDELPAIVVAVWDGDLVNLKVFTDGVGPELWKPSVSQGNEPGNWHWPKPIDFGSKSPN